MDNEDDTGLEWSANSRLTLTRWVESEGGLLENSHTVSCAVGLLLARAMWDTQSHRQ